MDDQVNPCFNLLSFQAIIAQRWLKRGEESADSFASYFFSFSALNALYFAWAQADQISGFNGSHPGDLMQVEHLVRKFTSDEAQEILAVVQPQIEFFSSRKPIQRMDKRTCNNFDRGKDKEGRAAQKTLMAGDPPVERLVALTKIQYLIRSNLVHGSKAEDGDDLAVVRQALVPIREIATRALRLTENQLES
ncbi:MAG TPA: hypothetical protein DD706_18560 [Nitrospiraceae bacterium]|nr:hypothetical protein [Nitrospiraceae bacterium]